MLELETKPLLHVDDQQEYFRWKCHECGTVAVTPHKGFFDDVVINHANDQHSSVTNGCPSVKGIVIDLLENWTRGSGVERLPDKFRAEIYDCPACDSWTRGTFCLSCIQ